MMLYVLYLVYAVGNQQPSIQHLGSFETLLKCHEAMIAHAYPNAFPLSFTKKYKDSMLKCRKERAA